MVGFKALPRTDDDPHFPGHMGVSWKVDERRTYRDFRFRIADLPPEFRPAERWRGYLFEHSVPGYVDNGMMLRDAHVRGPKALLCYQCDGSSGAVRLLEKSTKLGRRGRYSFSPDPEAGVHNCVTWAFTILNEILQKKLPLVRDGRMKLAVEFLRKLGATESV